MTLPDVNVWLALTLSGHKYHRAVRSWFESETQPNSIHFCRATQIGLLRLLCTKSVTDPYGIHPLNNAEALQVLDVLLEDECVTSAPEPEDILTTWRMYSGHKTASPKLWMDAWLAAFATCGGFQIVTLDKGFSQFPGLNLLLLNNNQA